jgi:hypothetical protein
MTTTITTTYVVAVGVADIRREPDPDSELVTQALMNVPAVAGEARGAWTQVTLPDYQGWIRTDQLEEPIVKGFCKVGETCGTALPLVALINVPHTPLYAQATGDASLGTAYLSTTLPLLDISDAGRIQVHLPGERSVWLSRPAIDIRKTSEMFPRAPISMVIDYARMFLGRPYLWGGTSWEGIDCSGLVQLCYHMGGSIIPRDANQQYDVLSCSVKREEMRAGDLIFFGSKRITHVALALNNKEYIHAAGSYHRVVINSFDPSAGHYYPRLDEIVWGIKRVVDCEKSANPRA